MNSLLSLKNVETFIGQYHILQDITFEVPRGEVTVLLGRNGAGKTTTLRTIMGLNPPFRGTIEFKGTLINGIAPHSISNKGIGFVPEDQGIFGALTVEENLKIAIRKDSDQVMERMDWILNLFPDLKSFWKKPGGLLSGGQKQMLSIARAFINESELLLIDEPSKGLAPIVVEKVMHAIEEMKQKTTIVLVEQNFLMASKIGTSFYIIDDGRTVFNGEMRILREDESLRRKYLGIA